jgi:hypothetical protein
MGMKQVHIAIDRLVVDGLPLRDKQAFVRALEEKLRALAADVATEGAGGTRRIAKVDAGGMRTGAGPEEMAAQVVKAVRRALGPRASSSKALGSGAPRPSGSSASSGSFASPGPSGSPETSRAARLSNASQPAGAGLSGKGAGHA